MAAIKVCACIITSIHQIDEEDIFHDRGRLQVTTISNYKGYIPLSSIHSSCIVQMTTMM